MNINKYLLKFDKFILTFKKDCAILQSTGSRKTGR